MRIQSATPNSARRWTPIDGKGGVFCLDADIAEVVQPEPLEGLRQTLTGVLPWAVDSELAERLWVLSEELTGVKVC